MRGCRTPFRATFAAKRQRLVHRGCSVRGRVPPRHEGGAPTRPTYPPRVVGAPSPCVARPTHRGALPATLDVATFRTLSCESAPSIVRSPQQALTRIQRRSRSRESSVRSRETDALERPVFHAMTRWSGAAGTSSASSWCRDRSVGGRGSAASRVSSGASVLRFCGEGFLPLLVRGRVGARLRCRLVRHA